MVKMLWTHEVEKGRSDFLAKIEHCQNSSKFGMFRCVKQCPAFFFSLYVASFLRIAYAKNVGFPSGIFLSNAKCETKETCCVSFVSRSEGRLLVVRVNTSLITIKLRRDD